jgi:hypothetical protein
MLILIGGLFVIIAVVSLLRSRRRVDAAQLGLMSERWLAENRAMHRP